MIHPSYSELMQEVNKETEIDEPPVVNSRYSIVLATSKRARQIIGGDTPLVPHANGKKPLSVAIEELYQGQVKIMPEDAQKEHGEGQEETSGDSAGTENCAAGDGRMEDDNVQEHEPEEI